MPKYRKCVPQLSGSAFVTEGGLETTLIFHNGIDLPEFAAFPLLQNVPGVELLRNYFSDYVSLATQYGVGLVLDTPTWRANTDWGAKLGFSPEALATINEQSVRLLVAIRDSWESGSGRIVISGCIGPRADGYTPSRVMSVEEATAYHLPQVRTFSKTEVDMMTVMTMNYVEEAIGVALAAQSCHVPVVVSFTVETDGKLPTGDMLHHAIERVDSATESYPAYYMVNCAHPNHLINSFQPRGAWLDRLRGLRANASCKSHAELNDSTQLDDGNPVQLGSELKALQTELPALNVLGGCCGTDRRHIEEICKHAAH